MANPAPHETEEAIEAESFIAWLGRGREGKRKSERTRTTFLLPAPAALARSRRSGLPSPAICEAAGIAHGTFYLHFSDKNALAGAC